MIKNRAKDYYENDKKKRIREQARNKYLNLSEEEKKRENMEEIDTVTCLKKKNRN